MLMQNDFIKKIKDFGLNSYEAKIRAALLSRGISSAGELSEISNVPRSRTYDVLESLEKKGFIIMKLSKPIKYMALPPEQVVDVLKKKISQESIAQEKHMDELKGSDILNELISLHTNGINMVEPSELVGMLKNRENMYNYIEAVLKNSEKSVCLMTSEEGLVRKYDSMKKTFKKLADSKIKMKIIVPTLTKKSEKVVAEMKNIAEIKAIGAITSRFIIVDDSQTIFMLSDDAEVHPAYDNAVWVNTPFFTNALKELFDNMWKKN